MRTLVAACSGTGRGALMLSSMPGRFEPLDDFIADLRLTNIGTILCLVADDEIARKSPPYLKALQGNSLPCRIQRLPVPDYGPPAGPEAFLEIIRPIWHAWTKGESVVIHCAAGCGRTSLAAVAFLMLDKTSLKVALERTLMAGSGPDTREQHEFLARLEQHLNA